MSLSVDLHGLHAEEAKSQTAKMLAQACSFCQMSKRALLLALSPGCSLPVPHESCSLAVSTASALR